MHLFHRLYIVLPVFPHTVFWSIFVILKDSMVTTAKVLSWQEVKPRTTRKCIHNLRVRQRHHEALFLGHQQNTTHVAMRRCHDKPHRSVFSFITLSPRLPHGVPRLRAAAAVGMVFDWQKGELRRVSEEGHYMLLA